MRARTATHTQSQRSGNENEHQPSRKAAAPKAPNYHQLVARATHDAVRDWNLSANTLVWRQGISGLLGYPESPEIHSASFWQEGIHPADHARVSNAISSALSSRVENWSGEYRFRHSDGSYRQLLERAVIVRDASGVATRFVGVLMDVTSRKQIEDQLCRSQKLEAFGQLAGGMAHDFNNFLTAIVGYSDLIVGEIDGSGSVAKYVSEIRSAAGRASSLTRQLLAFSRRQPLEPRVLEVNSLLGNLERSILRLLGENISVCSEFLARKGYIKVDRGQLTQIIVNLAVNARDAMGRGGTLVLKTDTVRVNGKSPLPAELVPGDYVVISVVDNGCGMTEEVKAHVFEPFFTTKSERHGSGLGLAACYGIVRQSGGHISLESDAGKGTAVHIYLPKIAAPEDTSVRKTSAEELPKGNETVLIVEDDASVRHVAVRTLRMLGYRVLEAWRADLAKRCIAENPAAIDLVVIDIVLPDMSGREFAHWVRVHTPHTQLLLISGYLPESAHDRDGALLLPKPFDPEQLATTTRQILDARVLR